MLLVHCGTKFWEISLPCVCIWSVFKPPHMRKGAHMSCLVILCHYFWKAQKITNARHMLNTNL